MGRAPKERTWGAWRDDVLAVIACSADLQATAVFFLDAGEVVADEPWKISRNPQYSVQRVRLVESSAFQVIIDGEIGFIELKGTLGSHDGLAYPFALHVENSHDAFDLAERFNPVKFGTVLF